MHLYLKFALLAQLFVSTCAKDRSLWTKLVKRQGAKVCAVEHVHGTTLSYSPPWTGGNICGKETIVKLACCPGYERIPREKGCPLVLEVKNIAETLKEIGASTFYQYADNAGLLPLLSTRGAYTVFATRNEAFQELTEEEERSINVNRQSRSRPPLLLFTIVEGRHANLSKSLDTLYRDGSLIISKFEHGPITVNCVPLIATNVPATNGIIHLTESLLLPVSYSTVADMIGRSNTLTTLSAAIVRAQMGGELSGREPITLFAPVDQAWESLPQNLMQALMDSPDLLRTVLSHHLLDTVWCGSSLSGAQVLSTVEGSELRLSCNESGHYVNQAKILKSDIAAGNGFVHYIDAVLIPEKVLSLAELLEFKGFTYFRQLVEAGGLMSILQRPGSYSVFAVPDNAFEELPNDTLTNLLTDTSIARNTASYHIASGKHLTTNFIDGQSIATISGQSLRIKVFDKTSSVEASIIAIPNKESRNGILHVLDKVLLSPTHTIADILKAENYSLFRTVLNATSPNLLTILSNTSSKYTVFAPNNKAMNDMPYGMLSRLTADPPLLYQMAARHILQKFLPVSGLETGLIYSFQSLNGKSITLRKETNGLFTVAALAMIESSNEMAVNGIVHQVTRFIDQDL